MQAADEYLETRVMTATPQELHLMVVDGAIRFATQAAEALDDCDFDTSHRTLSRSREFVIELVSGLDSERKDELIEQLRGMFGFVYRNLSHADIHHDADNVRDALKILHIHRDNWIELTRKLKSEKISATPHVKATSWST